MYWDAFLKIRERISDVKPWNRLFSGVPIHGYSAGGGGVGSVKLLQSEGSFIWN